MKRFITALTMALVTVLMIGGLVLTLLGGADQEVLGTARGSLLAQVEDDAPDEDAADDEPVAVQLSSIERLLAQLVPTGEGSDLPSAQRVVLSRDPFQPVVPEAVPDGGGGTDGGTDGTDGGTDGTDGGTDGTDGGTDGTDGGTDDGTSDVCTGDEQETVCEGIVVTLDGFTDDGQAIVTVDGTTFTVAERDEFATSFRVLAINEPCTTLLFGDETFSICTGATVLK